MPSLSSRVASSEVTLTGLAPLISIEELSEYLNATTRTLQDWRLAGRGPRAVQVGQQLRYFVTDVNEWLKQQREAHTTTAGRVVPVTYGTNVVLIDAAARMTSAVWIDPS